MAQVCDFMVMSLIEPIVPYLVTFIDNDNIQIISSPKAIHVTIFDIDPMNGSELDGFTCRFFQ